MVISKEYFITSVAKFNQLPFNLSGTFLLFNEHTKKVFTVENVANIRQRLGFLQLVTGDRMDKAGIKVAIPLPKASKLPKFVLKFTDMINWTKEAIRIRLHKAFLDQVNKKYYETKA